MKILLTLCVAAFAVAPAQAEFFRSGVMQRHPEHRHHGDRGRTTVHIGIGHGSRHGHWHGGYGHGYRHYHYPVHRSFGYYSPRIYYSPYYEYYGGYGVDYPYYSTGYYGSSAAANGLVLGALAGGIIGHNSGEFRHNGWRGAAWGAGVGWLLGTIADANRRAVVQSQAPVAVQNPAPVVVQQPQAVSVQPPAQSSQTQPVTIINNYYYSTPMAPANQLFGR